MATVTENINSIITDLDRMQQKQGEFECDLILNNGEGERVTYRFKSDGLLKILMTVIKNPPSKGVPEGRGMIDEGAGVRSPEDAL